jgi:hypothetical protein
MFNIKEMKNLIYLFFIVLSGFNQLNAQQASDKNWTLIHERAADWCPFCGTWGWEMKTKILEKFKNENVIFMAVHHSGGLNNPDATTFGDNFGGIGQPLFFVDGVNINANSNNINTKIEETLLEVDFKKSVQTLAGVGVEAYLSKVNNELTVNASVEFFTDIEGGDYYLGLYLVEDVLNSQASRQGLQLHESVLRRSLLPSTFGQSLQKAPINKGKVFTTSVTVPGIQSDRDKVKVIAVLWNYVNNKYLFFNANEVTVGIPASITKNSTKDDNDFFAYQSESGNIVVKINNENFKSGRLSISDVSGRILFTQLLNENQTQPLTIQKSFSNGMHIVTLSDGNLKISKKLILQ